MSIRAETVKQYNNEIRAKNEVCLSFVTEK